MLVVTSLRQGRTEGCTARRLQDLFGVTRSTLVRWLRYFREIFPHTRAWRSICARLWPPVVPGALTELINRFVRTRDDPEAGLLACLKALCFEPR
jgi:hypothetical protein